MFSLKLTEMPNTSGRAPALSTREASSAMWGLMDLPYQEVLPLHHCSPVEKWKAKKEEQEESGDNMSFLTKSLCNTFNKKRSPRKKHKKSRYSNVFIYTSTFMAVILTIVKR